MEKWLLPGLGLQCLVVPERKEVLRKGRGMFQGHRTPPERTPPWPNLEQSVQPHEQWDGDENPLNKINIHESILVPRNIK